jgi:hypothetical protein
MKYQEITWWPGAYHVFKSNQRVGVVHRHVVRDHGREREVWYAHNKHFFSIGSEFKTRAAAASVLDTKPIKHTSNAFK